MSEQQPIETEVVPSQAVATRPEQQAVVNPLDLDPGMFKAGLDRRKENRKHLIDWVKSSLVEGTDFGKIHTVGRAKCDKGKYCTNPSHFSKPSLFKPGAEKICGMLGVTPTFPTLKDYEDAALAGREIKSIVLRCEIVNSSGEPIAHGVGCRSLEQDYGDMNKALKMAEKSAHIDATLRMAGLSEIFTQDLEDLRNAPGRAVEPGPPSSPTPPVKTPPAASTAPRPKVPLPPSAYLAKFIINLDEANLREKATQFLIDLAWLMPNEKLEDLKPDFTPMTKEHYIAFLAKLANWSVSGKAEKPYERNEDVDSSRGTRSTVTNVRPQSSKGSADVSGVPRSVHEGVAQGSSADGRTTTQAERQAVRPGVSTTGEAEAAGMQGMRPAGSDAPPGLQQAAGGGVDLSEASPDDAQEQPWYKVIVPVPHKGEKRDEYLKHPDTIGSLYEARHDDEEARRRLFGFLNNYEPKGWTKNDGTEMPPNAGDIKFREALDEFGDWFDENHPDEKT